MNLELGSAVLLVAWFIGWVGLSFGIGRLAEARGRSFLGYFLGSLLLSPVLAGLLVIILSEPTSHSMSVPSNTEVKVRCTSCGDLADEDHDFCPHCGASMRVAGTQDESKR